ncbi:Mfa1 family fimbria major subunit [Bacteroides gallinaceum]|uniref:Mfa1 family fimbria major subunit n=1 Tax=Bacteroides gallinaceum TaxID=1462571 RepID=UPI0025AB1D95|nr:Mfa1 family fimbria major subunit [Bacteroides gallinaceum]MDN0066869.1 Mfa1 family fimbria major subunit [Bacteroides gallinaceum]
MKFSRFLVGTLACALMAACSNEENPAVDNGTQGQEGSSYMAVNLVMSTDAASRSATDGGFADGSENEGAVSVQESLFLFYDKDGKFVASGRIMSDDKFLTLNDPTNDTPEGNIEKTAIVAVGPTATKPAQVLAILNCGTSPSLNSLPLDQALEETVENISGEKGDFLMTNAVYVSDGKIVTATQVTEDNFVDTPTEAATTNAVNIYVERVAAKLEVKVKVDGTENNKESGALTGNNFSLNLETGTLMQVEIDGWCANAINTESYYVKKLSNDWLTTEPFSGWTGIYRTFWALDKNYTGDNTYTGLSYKSWSDAKENAASSIYLHENTIDNSKTDDVYNYVNIEGGDEANVTTVLVAAHIEYKKEEDKDWKTGNIFRYNGVYYTEDVMKQNIVSSGNYYWYYTSNNTEHWDALDVESGNEKGANIEFKSVTDSPDAVMIDVTITKPTIQGVEADAIKLVQGEDSKTEVQITDAQTNLEKSPYTQNLIGYQNGACYYQIPIEHLSSSTGNEFYGIVRNHWYELTITDITDIGGAVFNPDVELPIIPGKEKNYYMSAKLNILSWKVVKQDAVLN